MDVVCLSGSSCLDPPPLSRSIFFFYFTYTSFLVESALSLQAQIPVTLYSMRRSALSNCPFLCLHFHTRRCPCSPLLPLFSSAAVDLRWLIYWPASPPSGWVIDPFYSSLLISLRLCILQRVKHSPTSIPPLFFPPKHYHLLFVINIRIDLVPIQRSLVPSVSPSWIGPRSLFPLPLIRLALCPETPWCSILSRRPIRLAIRAILQSPGWAFPMVRWMLPWGS